MASTKTGYQAAERHYHSIGGNESLMTVTKSQSGTNVHEVADGIYHINTPVVIEGAGGFSVNQYLITDDEPLLFDTGLRKLFPLVRESAARPTNGWLPLRSL